jgi:oxygen-dependent protoporphyrinogen oxidase
VNLLLKLRQDWKASCNEGDDLVAKIAIVGAGIAGLSAAWQLQRNGFETVVFEARSKPGGRVITESFDGFFMDVGASFITTLYTNVLRLVDEVGMKGEVKPVYRPNFVIKRDANFHELKLGSLLSAMKFTGLTTGEKLSLVRLIPPLLLNLGKLNMHYPEKGMKLDDKSAYEYFESLCGKEVCECLFDTALSSFFLYSSRELTRVLGLIFMRYFLSFKLLCLERGLGSLSDRLASQSTVHCNAPVKRVAEKRDRVEVDVVIGGQRQVMDFDAVVVAVQGDLVPRIVQGLSATDREFFQSREYSTTYVVAVKSSIPFNETYFPIMVPAKESSVIALMVVENSKDPGRVPKGKGLLTAYTRDKWSKDFRGSPEQAGEIVCREAETIYPFIKGNVTDLKVFFWEQAVDKFPPGAYKKIDKFWKRRDPTSRLFYAGAYLMTPGVEAACETGLRVARAISQRFARWYTVR